MKPGLPLIWMFIFFCFSTKTYCQFDFQSSRDSLDYFLQKGDLVSLFSKIEPLAKKAAEVKNITQLDSLTEYMHRDFGMLDSLQKKALRNAYAWIGYTYKSKFGNYPKSLKVYLWAHQYAADKELLDDQCWAVENVISTIYTRNGDYEKADYFSKLVEKSLLHILRTKGRDSLTIERLSRYYTNLGIQKRSELKDNEALNYLVLGYRLADSSVSYTALNANAINLSEYYRDYLDFPLSEKYLAVAGNALSHLHKGNIVERKAELEFQTANLFFKKGMVEKNDSLIVRSIPYFKTAIDTLGVKYNYKKRREFAKYYIPLAEVYLELDSLSEAMQIINKGLSSIIVDYNSFDFLPQPDQVYAENSFVELFKLQSQLFQKQFKISGESNYLDKALQSIQLALKANDMIRDQVIADPSKLLAIRENKILTNEGLKITYELYHQHEEAQYLQNARKLFNRSKGLLLDEKTRRHRLMDQMSTEDSTRIAQLQFDIRELQADKFIEGFHLDSLNGLILDDQEKIDFLFEKYKEARLTTVQQADYIEYSIQEEDIYALSSLSGKDHLVKLGPKSEFLNLLQRLNEDILQKGLGDDQAIQNDLYHFLIEPLVMDLPAHLVIIPDGEIGFIPFDMLIDAKGKLLIEYCTLSYAYGYESYMKKDQLHKDRYEICCLVPSYLQTPDMQSSKRKLIPLPYAKQEVDAIRKLFGENAVVADGVDKASLAEELAQASIFHFAGHAIVRKDEAYLAFSNDGDMQKQWTDQEIALLPQSADLVVLSACETGLGKYDIGEGIRSLGRSFIESGASATVISLWNVNDKSTAFIMTAFYKYLLQGLMKDEALRKAKLEYLRDIGNDNTHPFFWAGFIPAGDMGAMKFEN